MESAYRELEAVFTKLAHLNHIKSMLIWTSSFEILIPVIATTSSPSSILAGLLQLLPKNA